MADLGLDRLHRADAFTVATNSLRWNSSMTGAVFSWYSRRRTANASGLSSGRETSDEPQTSQTSSTAGRWAMRL